MADKLTYATKESVTDNQLPDKNKGRAEDWNEIKTKYNALIDELGTGAQSDNKLIYSINSTSTLADFIAAITDSAVDNTYAVEIRPGNYTTPPVSVPSYVYIVGTDSGAVTINADATTDSIFTMGDNTSIRNVTVKGATSGNGVAVTAAAHVDISNIVCNDCDIGIFVNNANAAVLISSVSGFSTTTMKSVVDCTAGNINVFKVTIKNSSTYTNAICCSGSDVIATLESNTNFSPNVDYGIYITNGARVNAIGNNFVAGKTALYLTGNGSICFLKASVATIVQEYGVHIPNDATTPELIIEGVIISNSGIYDAFIENPLATVAGDVSLDLSKAFLTPGGDINLQVKNQFAGDKGVVNIGETHTGTPSYPSESVFGEGDSHVVQKVYTEDSISTFVDVTTEASSNTGSTYTYPDTNTGSAIYVSNLYPDSTGSIAPFYGIKVNIQTAAVLGAGNIIAEYWNGAWTELNCSTQLSGGSYWKYAKEYFNRTGEYHIKFDPDIITDWTPNDPVTLGTNYYWVRFRISSNITTAPVFEQNKISPNRSEKNPDGTDEYHGMGRTIKKVTLDASGPIEGNMQNSDTYVDENIGVSFTANRYTAVADIRGYSFELPEDCDTSGKLILVWKGRHAATGNAQFTVRLKVVKPGDSYTATEPAASGDAITVLTPITAVTQDIRQDYRVDIDISDAIPARENGFGDEIWVTIQNTTRSGNFDIVKVSANYLSDFNGRHL
jgi:hypothetical protein